MKIHYEQKEVALKGKTYSIYMIDTSKLYACAFDKEMYMIFGDQRSLQELACMFLLASMNKDKIIYVRNSDMWLPEDLKRFSTNEKNQELVFMHHSLQVNIGVWKDLRSRLRSQKGYRRSFSCNPRKFSDRGFEDYQTFYFEENNDKILIKHNFETLFLVGSRTVFEYSSGFFEPLSRYGAGSFLAHGGHAHVHLDAFTGKHQGLCVDFYDQALWNRQSNEV